MWPVSFDIAAAVRCVAVIAAGIGVIWLIGVVRRDAQAEVWHKIDVAIQKTNVSIDRQSNLDDKIAAIAEDARRKALEKARSIASMCPASPAEATALTAIQ